MTTIPKGATATIIFRACAAAMLLSTLLLTYSYALSSTSDISVRRPGGGDLQLFSSVVARLRGGTPYYDAMGAQLRAQGYPAASVMNWRTPMHLSTIAALNIPAAGLLFALLGLSVLIAGTWALAPRGYDAATWGAVCLAGATTPLSLVLPGPVFLAEAWCGFCIGLSLAAYSRQRWTAAAVCGVVAIFVRELAAPYVLICGLLAMSGRRRRESLVWILGGVAYFAYYAIHASFAHASMRPGDLSHFDSWVRWQGIPFVLATAKFYGWALIAPQLLVPIVVTGGLAATMAPTAPVQLRLAIVTYVVTFSIIGQPFNSYWGLVTAPLWAFGLAYSRDGLRWILKSPRLDAGHTTPVQIPVAA